MLDFVLAGAPKCGTTSIATGLAACPGVCLSNPKETFFFNPEFMKKHQFASLEDYEKLFSGPGLRGDGSIWSMYSPSFAQQLSMMSPNAKVILSLRSPEKMVASLYHYNLDKGYEDAPDMAAALELETLRSNGLRIPRPCPEPTYLLYRKVADYRSQIEQILNHLPQEQLMVFDFDAADKSRIVPEICSFIAAPVPSPALLPHDNPTSYASDTLLYTSLRAIGRAMRNFRERAPISLPSTGVIDRFRRSSRQSSTSLARNSRAIAKSCLEQEIQEYQGLLEKYGTNISAGLDHA